MRIFEVVSSLDVGGQERLVLRIVHALVQRGHDVQVVSFARGGALRGELGSVPVHELARRNGFDASLHARLWRLFRSTQPAVVHTHNAAPLIYAVPAAHLAGVRCVVHTKHGDFAYPRAALGLACASARWVDHFVAVSADTAQAARQKERPRTRTLTVIENGIPLDDFGPDPRARDQVRDELGIPRDAVVIGSVGRLVREKDYPLLVRAVAPLLSPSLRLVLVGDGTERAAIEAAIPAESRALVVLTGARHDVPRLLCSFDVFASSSRTEGMPLSLPEAMTTGLPIVATAVGGVPDVVPAGAGTLVPAGDASALREAIQALVADPSLRSHMGQSGRAYALARFGEERMLERYLGLYGVGAA